MLSSRSVAVAAVGLCLAASTAAGTAACSRDCQESSLALGNVAGTNSTPFTATARLTSDGDPVSGKRISFLVDGKGPAGEDGHVLGYAETDSDGTARLRTPGGLRSVLVPGNRPAELRAEFSETGGGEAYCTAKTRQAL